MILGLLLAVAYLGAGFNIVAVEPYLLFVRPRHKNASTAQGDKMISKSDMMADKKFCDLLATLNLEPEDFTCLLCRDNEICKFCFDPYNIHGNCLAIK